MKRIKEKCVREEKNKIECNKTDEMKESNEIRGKKKQEREKTKERTKRSR